MKYFLVSPFSGKNNGLSNYVSNAAQVLSAEWDVHVVDNDEGLRPLGLERKVRALAGEGDVVEVPDAWGLFSKGTVPFRLHCRLHAPLSYLQELNGTQVNEPRVQRECALVERADYLSSPSVANVDFYPERVRQLRQKIRIYPNPIAAFPWSPNSAKDIDLVFVGRWDIVKGADFLAPLLAHLDPQLSVRIVGVKNEDVAPVASLFPGRDVQFTGWLPNEETQSLMERAKVCIILSRFESYSYVAMEALLRGASVCAWDAGGIGENFSRAGIRLFQQGDVKGMAAGVLEILEGESFGATDPETLLTENTASVLQSVGQLLRDESSSSSEVAPASPLHAPSAEFHRKAEENAIDALQQQKVRVFGFSMMNEHAEQMWGCLLDKCASDYRFVSRKPLGYNRKFERDFPVASEKFDVYDWRFQLEKLAESWTAFAPDLTFIFNGNTPHFDRAVEVLCEQAACFPVYSELGWLPQRNHIYFDTAGANHRSTLARLTLTELLNESVTEERVSRSVPPGEHKALLCLQLPGDTTLSSEPFPLALTNDELIEKVREELPNDVHLLVRPHPRDPTQYSESLSRNIRVDCSASSEVALSQAHSVIGVNSTFLLEALSYEVNVYSFGIGVFSNKGLITDCSDGALGERWRNNISFDAAARRAFLRYLSSRQVEVNATFDGSRLADGSTGIYPIAEAWSRTLQHKSGVAIRGDEVGLLPLKNITETERFEARPPVPGEGTRRGRPLRKLRKLVKSPRAFYRDWLYKHPAYVGALPQSYAEHELGKNLSRLIARKVLGQELVAEHRRLAPMHKSLPNLAFRFHRTRWVYYGVSKELVTFLKRRWREVSPARHMDVAAMLCEAGCYALALEVLEGRLKENPQSFRKAQYLRLAHSAWQQGLGVDLPPVEAAYIEQLAHAFLRIEADQGAYRTLLFENRDSFHVVGNAPTVLGSRLGEVIDSKRAVFRFNSFDVGVERRADVGSKTDVWVKSPSFEEVKRKPLQDIGYVHLTGTNHLDRSPSAFDFVSDLLRQDVKIFLTPHELYSGLVQRLGRPPSAGAQLVALLHDTLGAIEPANISGIGLQLSDALKSPDGKRNEKQFYHHDWKAEIAFIRSVLSTPPERLEGGRDVG